MRRGGLLVEAALWAFLTWLYVGDLVVLARVSAAPVAAIGALPSLPLGLVGAAVALAGLSLFVVARVRAVPPRWRPRRLALVAGVSLVLVDLVVLSARAAPLGAEAQLVLAVQHLTDGLRERALPGAVVRDPALVEALLATLGPVPLFVAGEPVPRWQVQLRERCQGPAQEPGGAGPGTFLYCVSADRTRAWVSLVALPRGERFGTAALFGVRPPAVGEVVAPEVEAPLEGFPGVRAEPPLDGE